MDSINNKITTVNVKTVKVYTFQDHKLLKNIIHTFKTIKMLNIIMLIIYISCV